MEEDESSAFGFFKEGCLQVSDSQNLDKQNCVSASFLKKTGKKRPLQIKESLGASTLMKW